MTVRAQARRHLRRGGFRFRTVFAAEDNEISLALRQDGWNLLLDEQLASRMTAPTRLTWTYFCELQCSLFARMVAVDPCRLVIDGSAESARCFVQDLVNSIRDHRD